MNYPSIDWQYKHLIYQILQRGIDFEGRNGGTRALIHGAPQIVVDVEEEFPIISLRKINFDTYLREFLWEMSGSQNVNELGDKKYLWDTWANEDGDLPFAYGKAWRNFGVEHSLYFGRAVGAHPNLFKDTGIDQLISLQEQLRNFPLSRRMMIQTYDPFEAAFRNNKTDKGAAPVPPCHPSMVFSSCGERLHLHVMSRSQDVMVGLPGDLVRYALMLSTFAASVAQRAGILTFSFTNVHIYKDHADKLNKKLLPRQPHATNSPRVIISEKNKDFNQYNLDDYYLTHYEPHGHLRFELKE